MICSINVLLARGLVDEVDPIVREGLEVLLTLPR